MILTNKDVSKAQITRYKGKWLLCLKTQEGTKWLAREFKTATAAKSYFRCYYAPLGSTINEKHNAKTATYFLDAKPKRK
ncbi:MAG: hypothetical protein K2N68_04065 [Clostridia bacterium]|nr:hypothetical protein [Clostridia bacterium]